MNQLVEIEFNINNVESILRDGAPVEPSEFRMTDVVLFVPEVVLPTSETSKLVKKFRQVILFKKYLGMELKFILEMLKL